MEMIVQNSFLEVKRNLRKKSINSHVPFTKVTYKKKSTFKKSNTFAASAVILSIRTKVASEMKVDFKIPKT